MARWETYQLGNAVRLRRAGEQRVAHTVVVPTAASPIDETLPKAELMAEAERRGLDSSGTKAEIVERLNG